MNIQPAEISAILKREIQNFGAEAEVSEVGQVLSVGDGIARVYGLVKHLRRARVLLRATLDQGVLVLGHVDRPRRGVWIDQRIERCCVTS